VILLHLYTVAPIRSSDNAKVRLETNSATLESIVVAAAEASTRESLPSDNGSNVGDGVGTAGCGVGAMDTLGLALGVMLDSVDDETGGPTSTVLLLVSVGHADVVGHGDVVGDQVGVDVLAVVGIAVGTVTFNIVGGNVSRLSAVGTSVEGLVVGMPVAGAVLGLDVGDRVVGNAVVGPKVGDSVLLSTVGLAVILGRVACDGAAVGGVRGGGTTLDDAGCGVGGKTGLAVGGGGLGGGATGSVSSSAVLAVVPGPLT
jgi:hypothetical protein